MCSLTGAGMMSTPIDEKKEKKFRVVQADDRPGVKSSVSDSESRC